MSPTVLVIMVGGVFRKGGHLGVEIGQVESIPEQKLASESHMRFKDFLKSSFDLDTEFLINTYSTELDDTLRSFYPADITRFNFNTTPNLGYPKLLNDAVVQASRTTPFEKYAAVVFIRIDLLLKDGFFSTFKLYDKLTVPFVETFTGYCMSFLANNRPRINDLIFYVPRAFYNIFKLGTVSLHHESFNVYYSEDIGFMTDTMYTANSDSYPNPLYRIVNRPEATHHKYFKLSSYLDQGFDLSTDESMPKMPITSSARISPPRRVIWRITKSLILPRSESTAIRVLETRLRPS